MKQFILTVALLLSFLFSTAQQVMKITLGEAVSRVKERNASIKIAYQDVLIAKGDFNQTNSVLLPSIRVSHSGMATTNPLMAFGVKLNQQIVTQEDFDPSLLNSPDQITDFSTKIEIQQPIFNLDGIHQRKATKAKLEASSFQALRTKEMIALEVIQTYMQLQLAYKTVEVLKTAKKVAAENKRIAEHHFDQGLIQKTEILGIEVRVAELDNQMQYAKSNIKNVSDQLSLLMQDTTYQLLQPSDPLIINPAPPDTALMPQNRSDIQAMHLVTEAYYQQYQAEKMSFMPRLNAFGNFELHDNQAFHGSASGYLFGAQLSWDILNGTQRFAKAQKSKAEFEKSKFLYQQYLDQSRLELNKVQRMTQDSKHNLELTSQAMRQAKESLRIRTNRFAQGLEKTSDVLLAEMQFSQNQLEYYSTMYQYNYSSAYLAFLSSAIEE